MIITGQNKRTVILVAVAALLGLWVFIGAVVMPLGEKAAQLDRKIVAARGDLAKLSEMADKYITLAAQAPPALKQDAPAGGAVTADIESIAARLGAGKFIKKMVPVVNPRTGRQDEAAVTFEKVPYTLLIDLLQGVYDSSAGVGVRRARIAVNFDNRNNVNAEITFSKAY